MALVCGVLWACGCGGGEPTAASCAEGELAASINGGAVGCYRLCGEGVMCEAGQRCALRGAHSLCLDGAAPSGACEAGQTELLHPDGARSCAQVCSSDVECRPDERCGGGLARSSEPACVPLTCAPGQIKVLLDGEASCHAPCAADLDCDEAGSERCVTVEEGSVCWTFPLSARYLTCDRYAKLVHRDCPAQHCPDAPRLIDASAQQRRFEACMAGGLELGTAESIIAEYEASGCDTLNFHAFTCDLVVKGQKRACGCEYLNVDAACTSDEDCVSGAFKGFCDTRYPEGVCTYACLRPFEVPLGSYTYYAGTDETTSGCVRYGHCLNTNFEGVRTSRCYRSCSSDQECNRGELTKRFACVVTPYLQEADPRGMCLPLSTGEHGDSCSLPHPFYRGGIPGYIGKTGVCEHRCTTDDPTSCDDARATTTCVKLPNRVSINPNMGTCHDPSWGDGS